MQPDENTVWPEVFSCIQHPPGIRNTLFPQFLPGCPPLALWALFSALAHLPSWAPLWMPRVFCMNRSFWFLQAMSSWPYSLPVLQDGSSAACAIPDRVLIQSQQQTGGSPRFSHSKIGVVFQKWLRFCLSQNGLQAISGFNVLEFGNGRIQECLQHFIKVKHQLLPGQIVQIIPGVVAFFAVTESPAEAVGAV